MHGTKYSPPPCLASPSLVFYSVRLCEFCFAGFFPGVGKNWEGLSGSEALRDSAAFLLEHGKAGDRELFPRGLQ